MPITKCRQKQINLYVYYSATFIITSITIIFWLLFCLPVLLASFIAVPV